METDAPRMRAFLSYSRADAAFAEALRDRLRASGVDAYLDSHDIAKGEPWRERLGKLIESADVVLFLLSPESVASEICAWEVGEAERLGKRLLPVVARETGLETVPPRLERLNFAFLETPEKDAAEFPKLLEAIRQDADWIREHTRIGDVALRWDREARPSRLLLRGADIDRAEDWRAARTPSAPALTATQDAFIQASRRASVRRQRGWIGGASLIAVIMAGLAAIALYLRAEAIESERQAVAARDAAERNLAAAEQALNGLIFEIAQNFKDVEDVSPTTARRLLEEARDTAAALLADDPDNPRLLRAKAAMLAEFGDVYARIGDHSAAEDAYAEALALYRALAEREPANPTHQRNIAVVLGKQGGHALARGRLPDALLAYDAALGVTRALLAEAPADLALERDLATRLDALAEIYRRLEQLRQARIVIEEAIEITRRLRAEDPDGPTRASDLAHLLTKLGDSHRERGDAAAALDAYEQALALDRAAAAAEPENLRLQRDLSVSLSRIAKLHQSQKQLAPALTALEEALAIRHALAADAPEDLTRQADLARALSYLGEIRSLAGDAEGALDALRQSLAINRALLANDPASIRHRYDVSADLNLIGDAQRRAGAVEAALWSYREALAIRRALVEAQGPDAIAAQKDLIVSLFRVAEASHGAPKRQALLEAKERIMALGARGALDEEERGWLRIIEKSLQTVAHPAYAEARARARDAFAAGDWAEAATAQTEAVAALEADTADGVAVDNDLYSASLGSLSWYAIFAEDLAQAEAAARRGLEAAPDKTYLHGNLAIALMYQGRAEEAEAIFRAHKGATVFGSRAWTEVIEEDFDALIAAGLTHPQMAAVLRMLGE